MRKNIIIDTDPGQDDAVAIMMALGSPELEVLGITVVAGNVPLNLTARNTRIICELAGRTDIKIFAGADKPIRGDQVTAEHAHGSSGLDGIELFEPSIPLQAMNAIDFLLQTVSEQPSKTVSLCPIGPHWPQHASISALLFVASSCHQLLLPPAGSAVCCVPLLA